MSNPQELYDKARPYGGVYRAGDPHPLATPAPAPPSRDAEIAALLDRITILESELRAAVKRADNACRNVRELKEQDAERRRIDAMSLHEKIHELERDTHEIKQRTHEIKHGTHELEHETIHERLGRG